MMYLGRAAHISDCGRYRYMLERVWGPGSSRLLIVGLNPSTADAFIDDPTIRRCVGFAKRFGYEGLLMANLFAARSTSPATLAGLEDPIGPENDTWLRLLEKRALCVVAAWGNGGRLHGRSQYVKSLLSNLRCFGLTGIGEPRHPLYLAAHTPLEPLTR
jgi:hypothetical protein